MFIEHFDNHPMKSYFQAEYKSDWQVHFHQFLNKVEQERKTKLLNNLKSIFNLIFDQLSFKKLSPQH